MKTLTTALKNPKTALLLAPVLFTLSLIIILGANLALQPVFPQDPLAHTISQYVGREFWSSALFLLFNLLISALMLRFYLSARKSLSPLWFALSLVQILGFLGLSVCPHVGFLEDPAKTVFITLHQIFARSMFVAMFLMSLERLHLALTRDVKNAKTLKLATLLFALYSIFYVAGYLSGAPLIKAFSLLWESGYIYAFMALLIFTAPEIPEIPETLEASKTPKAKNPEKSPKPQPKTKA